jgi:glycosyltransferase involved in cell wall biosynthesis
MPKICLNMIVKNESKIIKRLLQSVLPLIDTYCICDTGSTDNTVEIIESFFKKNNMEGKIIKEEFQDFGYNRTFALRACHNLPNADYILLLDADMVLQINSSLSIDTFKNSLDSDVYFLFQGSDAFFYKNTRIVKNNIQDIYYWGVTHEYVKTPANTQYKNIEKNDIFIMDIGDGGSKSEKFARDIRLLKKGLEELPNNDRYTFYLANSYRDYGDIEMAIETYKKRIELGGWYEEVWISYYYLGKCYRDLNEMEKAVYYWLEGYNIHQDRIENLYEVISYYRKIGKQQLSYLIYQIADKINKNKTSYDNLFLQKDIYDYKMDYEFTIISYYCKNVENSEILSKSMKVLSVNNVDNDIMTNVLNNYKFYSQKLKNLECQFKKKEFEKNFDLLSKIGESIYIDKNEFISSTPSVCYDITNTGNFKNKSKTGLCVNLRFVNYRIGENGQYINKEQIITKNVFAVFDVSNLYNWKKIYEFELNYDNQYDDIYVGLEDIRLFSDYNNITYNANRGLPNHKMYVENGIVDVSNKRVESKLLNIVDEYNEEQNHTIEKNWVLFMNKNKETKMVYNWYPIQIGKKEKYEYENILNDNYRKLIITDEIETPNFFKWVRGSTNGITINDEIWFICHIFSYEDRRYYYHLIVVLDNTTYKLKKYTPLFTFEGEKVEYTLGFVLIEELNQFLIGYSLLDKVTKYMIIAKKKIDEMFIEL